MAKMEQMKAAASKIDLTRLKPKSDKNDQAEAILEDMDAYPLNEQMAAVEYEKNQQTGICSYLACGNQSDAADQLLENLMAAIADATAALNPKDLWSTWMALYKLMRFAQEMGWTGEDAYIEAKEQADALELSMDDTMDLDRIPVEDPKGIAKIQQLFDTCSVDTIDGQTPMPRVIVNEVEQIFHEQTKAEYLLKRQQLMDEMADGKYEKKAPPSTTVDMSSVNGGAKLEKDFNEFYLFHGTSDVVADLIADSDFLIKSSADNGWTFGKGVYAAEWVSHAQMFAMMEQQKRGDGGNTMTILLCRAFVGKVQDAGNWPNTGTPCPQVAQLEANIKNGTYHATTGSEWPQTNYKVHDFILPDDDQIMPEFICHCSW